jgi:hypothetical protein
MNWYTVVILLCLTVGFAHSIPKYYSDYNQYNKPPQNQQLNLTQQQLQPFYT